METKGRLVAGSHNRNEFILINADDIAKETSMKELSDQDCQICGDEIEITVEGEVFVACNECAFPVCRTCYEYERREGNQACPQCKTRYKRIKGSRRVEGDEEEEDIDDLENEFDVGVHERSDYRNLPEAILVDDINARRGPQSYNAGFGTASEVNSAFVTHETYGEEVDSENQALLIPPIRGKRTRIDASVSTRPMDPKKDLAVYGYGTVAWKERMDEWKRKQNEKLEKIDHQGANDNKNGGDEFDDPELPRVNEGRQPLSRKLAIPSSKISPYRLIIVLRLSILCLFFHYRILHPVHDAYGIWLTSIICEIWFAVSWILDQFPKWYPIQRETYLDRLSLRYEKVGKPSELAAVDVFVSTVDPTKEPPLITANTVLSILAVDYPVDKVVCYVSDDGAAMLTFEVLSETSEFARKWVPFCKKYQIEPRAPEWYFAQKVDYLKDKVDPTFVKERRAMKREYEEFKVRVNGLVATARKAPEEGWTMQDGTPWPGNNVRDHPGMIQVFLGDSDTTDVEGNELPRLIYVSREKKPRFNHHRKAGAMNALMRVSALTSNAPYVLNLDFDHYINNSKALREAMCFMMDPISGKRTCYVQFPQRFDDIDCHDRFSNRNAVFFDINMKALDGIQGPVYVGTGCVFRRQALYGYDAQIEQKPRGKTCNCLPSWCCCCCRSRKTTKKAKSSERSKKNKEVSRQIFALENLEEGIRGTNNDKFASTSRVKFEKKFGQSTIFIASTLMEEGGLPAGASISSLLKEAILVIRSDYEDKTEWGREIGWIYGSVTEDILTGFKMHCRSWRSVYCTPKRSAFKGSAPVNLSDSLNQILQQALGSIEILLSKHCPIWYGFGTGLKLLERFSYINSVVYPLSSIPLLAYCTLPAVCLLTGKFIIPETSNYAILISITLFLSIAATSILEMRWGGIGIHDYWRNEQFWVIGATSTHLFALFLGLLKALTGINANVTVTSKQRDNPTFSEFHIFKWTSMLILPMSLLIINIIGIIVAVSDAINNGQDSWGLLFGKLFFALWVIIHLYPFLKGFMGKKDKLPTIILVWSILLASIFTLLWVRINPFLPREGISLEECGLNCD